MRPHCKLSPACAELLLAMQSGEKIHYMSGYDSYYFRRTGLKRCTKQAMALRKRKLAENSGEYTSAMLVLTEAGKRWKR